MNIDFSGASFARIAKIPWLSRCGESLKQEYGIPTHRADDRRIALISMFSTRWADTNNKARGCLTEYLASRDYSTYGSTWNQLANQADNQFGKSTKSRLLHAIKAGGWCESMMEIPLPEVTPVVRASMGKQMAERLIAKAWDECLAAWILGHAALALMEMTYRRRFQKAPVFFETLLSVYESGHLPCGWDGELDCWPQGRLLVY